jgi:hypothetical protein
MITISRSLARHLRSVFRRAGIKSRGGLARPVLFRSSADGLKIRAVAPDVALEYHVPDASPDEDIAAPVSLLDDCQGKTDDPVLLESRPKNKVTATWHDHGIPQHADYDLPGAGGSFPAVPETFAVVEHSIWQTLRDASECSDRDSVRYALGNIHLRGAGGLVTTADGHQLFQCGGYQFPWSGDVMVPAVGVLGCADLADLGPLEIGKNDKSVAVRIARWTILLAIDEVGRYPKIDEIVADAEARGTIVRIPPDDAAFLAQALPRLPHTEERPDRPITLDANGQLFVRARGAAEAPLTELVLSRTTVVGEPVRIEMNRSYFERALRFGLCELRLKGSDRAILAFDDRRRYIWMPLNPEGALSPSSDAIRIFSAGAEGTSNPSTPIGSVDNMTPNSSVAPTDTPTAAATATTETGSTAVSTTQTAVPPESLPAAAEVISAPTSSSRHRLRKGTRPAAAGPIEQAVALRESLRVSVGKANELIRALKRQRQQSRLVQTTLASLKELQRAG